MFKLSNYKIARIASGSKSVNLRADGSILIVDEESGEMAEYSTEEAASVWPMFRTEIHYTTDDAANRIRKIESILS